MVTVVGAAEEEEDDEEEGEGVDDDDEEEEAEGDGLASGAAESGGLAVRSALKKRTGGISSSPL